jgi:hypothetical protein
LYGLASELDQLQLVADKLLRAIGNARAIANRESPKTIKLYDRTSDQITLDEGYRPDCC